MGTKMSNCLPEKTASFTRKYFLTLKFMVVPLSQSWGSLGMEYAVNWPGNTHVREMWK